MAFLRSGPRSSQNEEPTAFKPRGWAEGSDEARQPGYPPARSAGWTRGFASPALAGFALIGVTYSVVGGPP